MIKVKREHVITVEIWEGEKKKKDQGKQGGQKAQMQLIVELAQGSQLNSWPGTMQEELKGYR